MRRVRRRRKMRRKGVTRMTRVVGRRTKRRRPAGKGQARRKAAAVARRVRSRALSTTSSES